MVGKRNARFRVLIPKFDSGGKRVPYELVLDRTDGSLMIRKLRSKSILTIPLPVAVKALLKQFLGEMP